MQRDGVNTANRRSDLQSPKLWLVGATLRKLPELGNSWRTDSNVWSRLP